MIAFRVGGSALTLDEVAVLLKSAYRVQGATSITDSYLERRSPQGAPDTP